LPYGFVAHPARLDGPDDNLRKMDPRLIRDQMNGSQIQTGRVVENLGDSSLGLLQKGSERL